MLYKAKNRKSNVLPLCKVSFLNLYFSSADLFSFVKSRSHVE